jgi:ATP-binding cassette subfamily F protein uup
MTLLLSAQGLSKSYAARPLFADVTLELRAGERIGLIGPNGAGKSTLLKILAGWEEPDTGARTVKRGARIAYLPQDDTFTPGLTAREVLTEALASEAQDEHVRETRAAIILTQVGFTDHDQRPETMSGGWRKRLALARALVQKPELLLLDEPTNHLDLLGVVWLGKLLRSSSFGYLVATHDRAFLRTIADEIIEVNRVYPDGLFRVAGGYDEFDDHKAQFLEAQQKKQEAVANQVRRETDWLAHKARARTRKASSRIEAAAQRRDELSELKYRTASAGTAGIDFVATGRQTRKLLTATGISKALGGRTLFQTLDLQLSPGTKLGLLGANGSGKSTLMRTIAGQWEPDTGTIVRADGLRTVMFEQGRAALDLSMPLRRALCANGETVIYRDRPLHVAAWASRFLFKPEQLNVELSAFSGGEQARIRIAQLMLQPADVLLLDEPTNDLDIPSLELLEDSLEDFPGAVVLVSHDRDLIDRLCTEVIGLDGNGVARPYGSVEQWLNACEAAAQAANEAAKPAAAPARQAAPKTKKLSYHEQQEFDAMEPRILAAEEAAAACEAEVTRLATADHATLAKACQALEDAQMKVSQLYARWEELSAKRS